MIDEFKEFLETMIKFLPPVSFIFLLSAAPAWWLKSEKRGFRSFFSEGVFFCGVGALIGYITHLNSADIYSTLLPSLIIVIGYFFQLYARTRDGSVSLLDADSAYLSGTLTVVSFMVCGQYFAKSF